MSNMTYADVTSRAISQILNGINCKSFTGVDAVYDLHNAAEVVEVAVGVDYHCDAWSIINDPEFTGPGCEVDFSSCQSALEAVVLEARYCCDKAVQDAKTEFCTDLRHALDSIEAFAEDAGNEITNIYVSPGSILDNVAHDFEETFGNYTGGVYRVESKLHVVLQVESSSIHITMK